MRLRNREKHPTALKYSFDILYENIFTMFTENNEDQEFLIIQRKLWLEGTMRVDKKTLRKEENALK